MFGIGFGEFILISLLLVLVVGPEQLPSAYRKTMNFIREARRQLAEVRDAVERETESVRRPLEEVRDELRRGESGSGGEEPRERDERERRGE